MIGVRIEPCDIDRVSDIAEMHHLDAAPLEGRDEMLVLERERLLIGERAKEETRLERTRRNAREPSECIRIAGVVNENAPRRGLELAYRRIYVGVSRHRPVAGLRFTLDGLPAAHKPTLVVVCATCEREW